MAARSEFENLSHIDHQRSRDLRDADPAAVQRSYFQTTGIVLNEERDPTEVHVRRDTGSWNPGVGRLVMDHL